VSATLRTARSWPELERFRDAWDALRGTQAATDPDVFPVAVDTDERALRPHAVLLERAGEPAALALARLEQLELTARIGYRAVYRPRVRALTLVYGGLLGRVDEPDAALLLGELRREVSEGEADLLRLRALEVGSPLHRVASSAGPRALRERASRPVAHWELDLPDSYDAFLQSLSKSTRDGAKRYVRKLEREYGDALALETFGDASESERLFRDAGAVATKTYQHGLGVAFAQDEGQRRLTRALMDRGWFRAWVLYLAGEPVAFWHGRAYRGVFSTGVPGFDPAHADLRVGNYVLLRLIADLCADPELHTLDYGFGDAEYKRRFGTRCRWEQDVHLYAPGARGLRINAVRSGVAAVGSGSRRLLERGGRLGRLKRGWRERLARGRGG
jgi:CelD/BcsL family acetyltransferase involved in cellulose biosynthesis